MAQTFNGTVEELRGWLAQLPPELEISTYVCTPRIFGDNTELRARLHRVGEAHRCRIYAILGKHLTSVLTLPVEEAFKRVTHEEQVHTILMALDTLLFAYKPPEAPPEAPPAPSQALDTSCNPSDKELKKLIKSTADILRKPHKGMYRHKKSGRRVLVNQVVIEEHTLRPTVVYYETASDLTFTRPFDEFQERFEPDLFKPKEEPKPKRAYVRKKKV